MLRGSCCCGAVTFELSEPPTMLATCHCTRCRKLGMSTFAFVVRANFALIDGAERISVFEPAVGYKYRRCFCSACGTSLGEIIGDDETFPIPANCFDDPINLRVRFHEFVEEKPEWELICDEARQFARHPVSG